MDALDKTIRFLLSLREYRNSGKKRSQELPAPHPQEKSPQQREAEIEAMVREFERMEWEEQKKHRMGSTMRLAGPATARSGEDPEIVAEAWRRFVQRREQNR